MVKILQLQGFKLLLWDELDTCYLKYVIHAMDYFELVISPLVAHNVGLNFKLVAFDLCNVSGPQMKRKEQKNSERTFFSSDEGVRGSFFTGGDIE